MTTTQESVPSAARLDAVSALESIVRPRSVAVVGANEQLGKLTSGSVRNLVRHAFPGRLHVVNPSRPTVFGVPTVRSLLDIPESVDTAVIVVSAARVPQVIEECAAAGIRTATVVASGFSEGAEAGSGQTASQALRAVLDRTGVRILGPNTAGLLNIANNYIPRASENHPQELRSGRIGVVSQSGGLCNTLVNRAQANHVGIGLAVSTGNQVDLDLWDVGRFMVADPSIDTIVAIVEGFHDAEKFVRFAHLARAAGKPVIALKLGVSEAGQRVVQTHSGSLAGSPSVQRAALADLNIIQVDELDELWEIASLFSAWGLPAGPVQRLQVITPSGGDGAIAVDEASRVGLTVPTPSPPTIEAFANLGPVPADNPFDTQAALVSTTPDVLVEQIALAAGDPAADAALLALPVLATPFALSALGPHVDGLVKSSQPRVAASLWQAGDSTSDALDILRANGWPIFASSVRAVRALGRYGRWAARRSREPGPWRATTSVVDGTLVTYWAARQRLEAYGVSFNTARLVRSVPDALAAAAALGYPVTLKLSSTSINHKAAAGAVLPYLIDPKAVQEGAQRLLEVVEGGFGTDEGLVVEEYVAAAMPLFLGALRDPEFGPVLLIGLGGGFAEAYQDVTRVSCPATADQVSAALAETTVDTLLAAHPDARRQLVEVACTLSALVAEKPTVVSFDINPIFVRLDSSLAAVDARLVLAPEQ